MTKRHLVWLLAVANTIVVFAASTVDPHDDGSSFLYGAAVATLSTVGALLFVRVRGNPIGALLLAAGTMLTLSTGARVYGALGASRTPPWPASVVALITEQELLIYPILITLVWVPLVFPDGHLPSSRFRWILWLTIAAAVASTIANLFGTYTVGPEEIANPFAIAPIAPLMAALGAILAVSSVIFFAGAATAVWIRFHSGTPVVRAQTKWLMAIAAVAAIAFPVAFTVPSPVVSTMAFGIGVLAMIALPLAIGAAVLRYRLYEIDRIVSRTVGYTLVSAILATIFAGTILLLESALARYTEGQTIAVAASTLAVFALFQPIRRRVQGAVDARFDRARYDADRTIRAFTTRLRDEVDLESVRMDIVSTAMAAVRPRTAGVWLRPGRVA